LASVHVDAVAAAVDLAGAKLHEGERSLGDAALLDRAREREQDVHGLGDDHGGVFHSCIHGSSLLSTPRTRGGPADRHSAGAKIFFWSMMSIRSGGDRSG